MCDFHECNIDIYNVNSVKKVWNSRLRKYCDAAKERNYGTGRRMAYFEEEAELAWISKCDLIVNSDTNGNSHSCGNLTYVTHAGHGASTKRAILT